MTLKQILNKINSNVIPIISLGIGLDSLIISRSERNVRLKQDTNEILRLSSELERNKEIVINQQETQSKIVSLSNEASNHVKNIEEVDNSIKELNNKLNNINLTGEDKNTLIKELDNHYEILRKSLEITKKDLNRINNIINENIPKENNIFGDIQLFIESYRNYLSTLEVEQIVAIIHLSGLVVIISNFITIFSMIYGDYLINYLNLDSKYPKIHKILLLRRKINKYSLYFNIIMIIFVLLILLILDLYLIIF
jgi:hypothetical protein